MQIKKRTKKPLFLFARGISRANCMRKNILFKNWKHAYIRRAEYIYMSRILDIGFILRRVSKRKEKNAYWMRRVWKRWSKVKWMLTLKKVSYQEIYLFNEEISRFILKFESIKTNRFEFNISKRENFNKKKLTSK